MARKSLTKSVTASLPDFCRIQTLTEFEQRAAYFDGIDILDRGSQVHAIGEFQGILDFPPAPKL